MLELIVFVCVALFVIAVYEGILHGIRRSRRCPELAPHIPEPLFPHQSHADMVREMFFGELERVRMLDEESCGALCRLPSDLMFIDWYGRLPTEAKLTAVSAEGNGQLLCRVYHENLPPRDPMGCLCTLTPAEFDYFIKGGIHPRRCVTDYFDSHDFEDVRLLNDGPSLKAGDGEVHLFCTKCGLEWIIPEDVDWRDQWERENEQVRLMREVENEVNEDPDGDEDESDDEDDLHCPEASHPSLAEQNKEFDREEMEEWLGSAPKLDKPGPPVPVEPAPGKTHRIGRLVLVGENQPQYDVDTSPTLTDYDHDHKGFVFSDGSTLAVPEGVQAVPVSPEYGGSGWLLARQDGLVLQRIHFFKGMLRRDAWSGLRNLKVVPSN